MAVESPQISIDSYKSTVPLVQIPQQDLQGPPQQGGIYSKAGGIATIADGAMKGLLRGLQLKEEKKYKTAEAVMNAQDAAIGDAKKQYQDALMTKGKDDAETQAKWGAYTKTVNDAASARQAFAVPEKTPKQPKGAKKAKTAADGAPAAGGFGDGLKQFFAQNPHIVPELAIIGMKSQVDPKLYGQMTPEMTAQKTQMDAAQRQEANQKVTDAARGTYDKYAGRSNLTPQEQEDFENAKAVLTPITPNQKFQVLVDDQGQEHNEPIGTEIPRGWKVYEKPSASQTPRAGTEQEFTSQALKGYGYTNDTAPPGLLKYLHDSWAFRQPQTASTTSGSTVDAAGNRTSTTNTTRGSGAPKPPAGFAPLGEDGKPLKEVPKQGAPSSAPQGSTQFTVGSKPKGMVEEGTLPIWNRPTVQNADGSHSSELSVSMGDDQGREVLVPMVVGGKFLTPDGKMPPGPVPKDWEKASPAWKALRDKAWKHFQDTGENLGKFDNPDDADAYAQILHNRGNGRGKMTKAPSAPGAGRGAMTAAPTAGGKPTLTQVNREMHVETEEKGMYDKATAAYQKALATNKAKAPDKASLDAANAQAEQAYNAAKAQVVLWKAGQIKAVGGDPWKAQAAGQDGATYGTMDGTNWVNTKTGYPYQEQ
jgi:uncharacterized protein YbdZ (MbtH family)